MTDKLTNVSFQLNQALNQLLQAAPSSSIARQVIEVVVQHLDNNQIRLTPETQAQLKAVLLPTNTLQGSLTQGQRYQIKLASDPTPALQFLSDASPVNTTKLPLSEALTQQLLKLPANQLKQILSLSQINLTPASNKSPGLVAVLQGTVALTQAHEQNANLLKIDITGTKPTLQLTLPLQYNAILRQGEPLSLELISKGKNWQLNVVKDVGTVANVPKTGDQVSLSTRENNINSQKTPIGDNNTSDKPKVAVTYPGQISNTPTTISKVLLPINAASELVKLALSQYAAKQDTVITLPMNTVIKQLSEAGSTSSQVILDRLTQSSTTKVELQIKAIGDNAILINQPKLIASLPLDKTLLDKITPLNLKDIAQVRVNLSHQSQPSSDSKVGQSFQGVSTEPPAPKADVSKTSQPLASHESVGKNQPKAAPSIIPPTSMPPADVVKTNEPKLVKGFINTLPEFKLPQTNIDLKIPTSSLVTPELLNNKAAQSNLMQSLQRLSQPKAELASVVLTKIEKILTEPQSLKLLSEPIAQNWLKQTILEVQQAVPQGNERDASHIKQLLSAPPLSLSPVQLVAPPASQGMLSGLITLLQVSLASRLTRNQPSQAERIAQILPAMLTEGGKTEGTVNTTKAMQEFAQLEQRHQLIREISRLLADHQSSKLNNAEKLLQGQETFYYNLPSLFNGKFNNIELLIKREDQDKEQQEQQVNNTKSWQLTMKLSVGELGEILTKAKLRPDHVELDFYTSNEQVKHQVMNFLPLLKRRLTSLGIEVNKSQCQLGKIPSTLQERPYHIFMAKA